MLDSLTGKALLGQLAGILECEGAAGTVRRPERTCPLLPIRSGGHGACRYCQQGT